MSRLPLALALAASLAVPAALAAQDRPPRDTIVIVTRDEAGEEAPDTLRLGADGARRTARRPFEVRSSGRVAPHGPPRDVVWMHPDSIRRARGEDADADTASADSIVIERDGEEATADDEEVVLLDTASAEARPARRRSADEAETPSTRRRNADEADEPAARRRASEDEEDADAAPARPASRTAARDSAASGRRTGRAATERGDTASTRRTTRTASRDTASTTRRTASRDTASTRRTASRDTASTRRTTSRDTASSRRTSTTAAGGRARTHTVASGETFFGIARRYGVTSAQLRAINPDVEWERLPVGTVLRLPAAARAPAQSGQRTASEGGQRPTQRGRRTHTVAQGETLFGIARRYGVTVDALREANDIDGDRVRIGQTLTIPRAQQ